MQTPCQNLYPNHTLIFGPKQSPNASECNHDLWHAGSSFYFRFVIGVVTLLSNEPRGRIGVDTPKELPGVLSFGVPIELHSLCAAGVRSPETRGLLGNFGTGVFVIFPVKPCVDDSLLDFAIRSTICSWSDSRFLGCWTLNGLCESPGPKSMSGGAEPKSDSLSSTKA